MKALSFYILLFLVIVSLSCRKKKYPESEEIVGEVVYFSKLTVDNMPVSLEAGVNGYYMYSTYKQDSNNVYSFIGDLKPTNCANCPSLKVQINDFKASGINAPVKIDSSLHQGNYPYLKGHKEPSYAVQYNTYLPSATYHWDFGDGTSSEERNPLHTYAKAGKYNVCLTTSNNKSCVSTICNKEKIDLSGKSCKTMISFSYGTGNSVVFTHSTTGGQAPYQFLWNFGDGSISNQSSPVYHYKYRGSYPVSLKVVDALGDTAIANYNIITQNDNSSCAANYYKSSIKLLPSHLALSNVVITWADTDGTVYTSNNPLQPSDAYFQIVSVGSGEQANENGQPIKKLALRFKCKVYNGNKSISIDNAEATICVAYK